MPETLRGALVGCGFFSQFHLEAWQRMEGVEIVAACDPRRERAQAAAPRAYTEIEALLDSERVDFLDIATRPNTHFDYVKLAIDRRLPVICQKPIAETLEQAQAMARLAGQAGVPVMVHENWRWQPWYRDVKARVAKGEIGAPMAYSFRHRQRDGLGETPFPNQPYFRDMPRLLVYETLIHPMDTARFLFGDIRSVYAHLRRGNPRIAGEDRALLTLAHTSDVDGVIDGHRWTNPEPPGPAMGDAIFEGEEGVLRVLANGQVFLNATLVTEHRTDIGYKGDSVRATQQHFVDCLRSGAPFETGVSEYLNSFATVEAAYASAEVGRRVLLV